MNFFQGLSSINIRYLTTQHYVPKHMVEFGSLGVDHGFSTLRAPHSHRKGLNTTKSMLDFDHNHFEYVKIIVEMFKLNNEEYDANTHAHYLFPNLRGALCPTNSLANSHS